MREGLPFFSFFFFVEIVQVVSWTALPPVFSSGIADLFSRNALHILLTFINSL